MNWLLLLVVLLYSKIQLIQAMTKGDSSGLRDSPVELPYYTILADSKNVRSLHPGLKYPTYQRCIIPEKLTKREIGKKRKWRLYWSEVGWDYYFFENGDEMELQEEYKERPKKVENKLANPSVALAIAWTTAISLICLLIYPLLSMVVYRLFLILWSVISGRWLILLIRKIVIRWERRRRNTVLRIYKDAGRKPPVSRYSLPGPLRLEPYEPTPRELDESDLEFWSSDDEEFTVVGKTDGKVKVILPMPEFTPKYPEFKASDTVMSKRIFKNLKNVRQYGMLACWTEGVDEIDLDEVGKIQGRPPPVYRPRQGP